MRMQRTPWGCGECEKLGDAGEPNVSPTTIYNCGDLSLERSIAND